MTVSDGNGHPNMTIKHDSVSNKSCELFGVCVLFGLFVGDSVYKQRLS